jgi:DNA ligase-1
MLMLAKNYETQPLNGGWYVSEKLDGVRAYLKAGKLYTRQGNIIRVPAWFLEGMPDCDLDGELFIARGQFSKVAAIVRKTEASDEEWSQVRYCVFDAPGGILQFKDNLLRLQAMKLPLHVDVVAQHLVHTIEEMRSHYDQIVSGGGEGIMLRYEGSLYEPGRSDHLLKVKPLHDSEAIVIGYTKGKGRNNKAIGALQCRLPNGTRFDVGVGLSDADRKNPPPIDSLISFQYQELTPAGVPRFPVYLRVREQG